MEPRSTKLYDQAGRELEATFPGEGFIWELWLDLETKAAIIRKRFPNNVSPIVGDLKGSNFVDYQSLLKDFVASRTKK